MIKNTIIQKKTTILLLGLFFASFLLAGCAHNQNNNHKLKTFIQNVKSHNTGSIQPIAKNHHYKPYIYQSSKKRSPFRPTKKKQHKQKKNALHPNSHRPKGPLESFPLSSLHMVGTIQYHGSQYALIQNSNHKIFKAKKGDYIGEHDGLITQVNDHSILIKEIVPESGSKGYKYHLTSLDYTQSDNNNNSNKNQ